MAATKKRRSARVAIIMGSRSDLKVMNEARRALREMKIEHNVEIVSAHRTPEYMAKWADKARDRGIEVIIAGAGGAAHLPGMVASLTTLPVIGVPIIVGRMHGLDALLSIAQMPKGVPVACVAVDNAFNAGLLAARIIGSRDAGIAKRLERYRFKLRKKIMSRRKVK